MILKNVPLLAEEAIKEKVCCIGPELKKDGIG
jgi:hypothetical protein